MMMNNTIKETPNKNDKKTNEYLDPETKKFKPGNPGGGRPKGSLSVVEALKKKLEEVPKTATNKEKRTYLELLIDTILEKGTKEKDVVMIKDIIDRVDGKPTQKIAGDKDNPLFPDKIEITFNETKN